MATAQLGTIVQHLRRLAVIQRTAELGDAQLLKAFAARRDEAAFAALLHRHAGLVYGACRRLLGNVHDAEDAFQATFLVLVKKAATIRAGESLGCWLYEIAYRTALRARTVARKQRTRERQAHTMNATSSPSPAELPRVEPLLDEELNRLPERYRRPLVLCYLEGKTHAEAAELLGCPKGTVSGRVARARDLLRRRLTTRGVTLTASALTATLTRTATATVPASLLDATLQAGLSFAVGGSASSQAVHLAKEVLHVMSMSKLRLAVLALALFGLLGGGLAYLAHSDERPQQVNPAVALSHGQRQEPLPPGAMARLGSTAFRHGDRVLSVIFTHEGKRLISSSKDKTIRLWDAATGREMRRFNIPGDGVLLTGVSTDSKLLAAFRGNVLIVWEIDSGKELHRLRNSSSNGALLTFVDANKTLLLANRLGAVDSWDAGTGKPGKTIAAPENIGGMVNLVGSAPATSPDGKLLVLPYSDQQNAVFPVRLLDRTAGKELARFDLGEIALVLEFSPDSKTLAAGTMKGEVVFWDVATRKRIGALPAPRTPEVVTSLAFAPGGKLLAMAHPLGAVELWDVSSRRRLFQLLRTSVEVLPFQSFPSDGAARHDLAFSPDGKRLAVGAFGSGVALFDTATGKCIGPGATGHRASVRSLGLSSDGKVLVTYVPGDAMRSWDLASGKQVRQVDVPGGAASAALSADGATLASVTDSGATGFHLVLYDTATGRPKKQQLRGSGGLAPALVFSPDGELLAARGDRKRAIRIWNVTNGQELPTPEGEETKATGDGIVVTRALRVPHGEMAFSPDGRLLAAADVRNELTLFEVATGIRLRSFSPEPGQTVGRFCFSPDGHTLAVLNRDATVTLYETTTGRKRTRLGNAVGPSDPAPSISIVNAMPTVVSETPYALAFSRDGRLLAAGGREIRLFDVLDDRELATHRGHQGAITALTFDAAGSRLISGSADASALVWDVNAAAKTLRTKNDRLAPDTAKKLWADLAGDDAEKAFTAIRALCFAPADAVGLLKTQLRPVKAPDPKRVSKLIADVDDKSFSVRARATAELEALGDLIGPAARRAVEGAPLEVRQRLEPILKKIRVRAVARETLASLRGAEVLEKVGTDDARRVLSDLAAGAEGARLTQAAREALQRPARRK
jgi:RNA polymerase sigma factor (sigma-70 family)